MKIRITVVVDHDQDPDTYDVEADIRTALEGLSLTSDHHAVVDDVKAVEIDQDGVWS